LKAHERFDAATGTYRPIRNRGRRGRPAAVSQRDLMADSMIGADGKLKFATSRSKSLGAVKK
jgi:hypothetical protein